MLVLVVAGLFNTAISISWTEVGVSRPFFELSKVDSIVVLGYVGRNLWICAIHGSACANLWIHSLRRNPWMFAQSMDFA